MILYYLNEFKKVAFVVFNGFLFVEELKRLDGIFKPLC